MNIDRLVVAKGSVATCGVRDLSAARHRNFRAAIVTVTFEPPTARLVAAVATVTVGGGVREPPADEGKSGSSKC